MYLRLAFHYVDEHDLVQILLPPPPWCWDYWHALPCQV